MLEILLACGLSVWLMSLALIAYQGWYRWDKYNLAQAQVQQRGYTAQQVVSQALQHIGLAGCQRPEPFFLEGKQNQRNGLPADQLSWNSASDQYADLLAMTNASELQVNEGQQFNAGQEIMISDCQHAELGYIAYVGRAASKQQLQLQTPLHFHYGKAAIVSRWHRWQFFLTGVARAKHGDQLMALMVRDGNEPMQEVVTGIDSLQFLYRTDQTRQWLLATQVHDWSLVKMIKLGLVASNDDPLGEKFMPEHYCLFDQCWQHGRYLQQAWYSTVTLLNV
jgi:hypothetical protein